MSDPDIAAAPPAAGPGSQPPDQTPGPSVQATDDSGAPTHDAPTTGATPADMAEASTAEADAPAQPPLPDPVPHAGARYALLRLLVLVAVAGVLYVVGMRGWLLAFTAVLVSGIVSLFLFMKQRNDAAVNLEHKVDSWKHRHAHEDAGLAQD
jgi:Protein of unknown function (DUF4229)